LTEVLTISSLAHRGDGVAQTASGDVYVPCALPGETVEAKAVAGHPDRRHLLRVIEPSPERIAPFCPHFGVCGGCAIQHWQPERYREWKHGLVVEALAQAGVDAPVGELIDAHGAGRRRATLHARRSDRDVLEVGFTAVRAHQVIGIDRCPVLAPALDGAVAAAWAIAEELRPERKPLDIQVTASESGLDVDVRGSGPLSPARTAALGALAGCLRLARLTRHGELVIQIAPPTLKVGRARVMLPPGSFLQATAAGEDALAKAVIGHAGKAKAAADLFCGIGPFALRLAEAMRVRAFDSSESAVASLRQAASNTSGLKPLEAQTRDLFRRPLVREEMKGIDVAVFDPPRQGAEAQARELARSAVPVVIAVSCNPATFARDARLLVEGGYRLEGVTPIDQFRHTAHVELVARFAR
jgi:23S rRNA (uracil1939-C5)-methyltransferase